MKEIPLFVVALVCCLFAAPSRAEIPVSGKPVPALSFLEEDIQTYMEESYVDAAVVGISRFGKIVYCRGFGWKDHDKTIPLQESAAFRIASITKTFTAAVIVDLVAKGMLDPDDHAFDLGQAGGGILDLKPFPGPDPGDPRLADITVHDLVYHTGGWDRLLEPDPTNRELFIKSAMGLTELPTEEETMRWTLGQPLQHDPGGTKEYYANIGYLALGLIAEQISGTNLLSYVRTYLLTDDLWFPAGDIFMGRTFAADQDSREPYYDYPVNVVNVFDPSGPRVWEPYGGWNHEVKTSYGRMVSTVIPLLQQAHHYALNGVDRGQPIDGTTHLASDHGGALRGSRSILFQGSDGIDVVVMTNRWDPGQETSARDILNLVLNNIDSHNFAWHMESVDCRWFDFNYSGAEEGSFDRPFDDINDLGNVPSFAKVRFKPGSTSWSGVITRGHLELDTLDGGSAVIGLAGD